MFDPSQPPLVSETLLKKRRSLDELAHRRAATLQTQNKRKRVVRGENIKIKRPEQFLKENEIREGSKRKMQRRQRQEARRVHCSVPASEMRPTCGFVVRIHAGRHASDEIKAALREMKLNKKYDGKFIRLDEETIATLRPFDAYLAYGYISQKAVNELMHRRSYAKVDGARHPLSSNLDVEKALGQFGMLCIRDLVNELYTVGPSFDKITEFLMAYKLSSPVGHFEKKILNQNDQVEDKGGFLAGDGMEEFLTKIL